MRGIKSCDFLDLVFVDASKEIKEVNTPEKVTSGPANNSDEIAS